MGSYLAVYDSRNVGARFLAACVFGWSGYGVVHSGVVYCTAELIDPDAGLSDLVAPVALG